MIGKIIKALDNFERNIRNSFGKNISTKSGRFWANVHFQLMDHAFIRIFWNNFHEISEGVYRANQPSPSHLKSYKKLGVKSVLSLRGRANQSYDLFEDEYCKRLGLNLIYIQVLRELPKPLVLHCKSGADRAGLVSALYLLAERKQPVSEAKKQLSFKYLHLDFTKTGILDYIFDVFSARSEIGNIDFLDWLKTEYTVEILNSAFKSRVDWKRTASDLMEFSNAKYNR
ncbi:MAG: protein tyrosine phosphatase [Rhodobacterales bacterium]|nr:protein tyrosine phosphatase [Rhodobacterales bacterium]